MARPAENSTFDCHQWPDLTSYHLSETSNQSPHFYPYLPAYPGSRNKPCRHSRVLPFLIRDWESWWAHQKTTALSVNIPALYAVLENGSLVQLYFTWSSYWNSSRIWCAFLRGHVQASPCMPDNFYGVPATRFGFLLVFTQQNNVADALLSFLMDMWFWNLVLPYLTLKVLVKNHLSSFLSTKPFVSLYTTASENRYSAEKNYWTKLGILLSKVTYCKSMSGCSSTGQPLCSTLLMQSFWD